ncbi:hypothetical protein GCK32_009060 [Trichostrongylus colubriformis]|uniref:c-SKI SMAD4-binding domain-containing protein n=1 Tax=Trichostrongylus colubriformis TaxID=6319 RepID=A0AAN8FQR5_TRICO
MAAATQDAALTADPLLYRLPEFPSVIPIAPGPAMSPCESEGIAAWVNISGVSFPAMVMGGEPRVPIHLLLSRVLFTQGVSEIQAMMDDLNIHKSIATNEQAERLRKMDAEVSGTQDLSNLNLVTRSDAERICGIIRIESTPSTNEEPFVDESDRLCVQHAMFGTVKGWAYPSRKGGRSVRCQECECFFTPEDFVAHSHSKKNESQRTVHWGFDPSNWRLMLELARPSSESTVNKERWKQFIDEPITQSCGVSGNCEGYSVKKAKRMFTDQSLVSFLDFGSYAPHVFGIEENSAGNHHELQEIPTKIIRSNNIPGTIEKPLPLLSDSLNLSQLYLRENLNRLLGANADDPVAVIEEVMQKETAFKIKSLAAVRDQSSGVGQLLALDQQPNNAVPHPSSFKTVSEKAKEIQSSCDQLGENTGIYLETSVQGYKSYVDGHYIGGSSVAHEGVGTLAEYERLRNAYEFLFTLYRQLCDPFGYSNDALVQATIAKLRGDQIALGVTVDSNDALRAQTLADLSQQQQKLASLNAFESIPKATMPLQSLPTASAPMDSQMLQQMLTQQLLQLMVPPQLTQ